MISILKSQVNGDLLRFSDLGTHLIWQYALENKRLEAARRCMFGVWT